LPANFLRFVRGQARSYWFSWHKLSAIPVKPLFSSIHYYHFTLYALDVPRCPVEKGFSREEVLAVIKGHVLVQTSITGIYSLNSNVPA